MIDPILDRAEEQFFPAPLFSSAADLAGQEIEVDALIEGIMESRTTNAIVGASGSGKSFVVTDIACSLVTARPWNGHEVKPGGVLYLAGEGRHGFPRRVKAWLAKNGEYCASDLRHLYISNSTLLLDGSNTRNIVQEVADVPIALVIVDTLARHIVGDESSPNDMGQFINVLDNLRDRLNCAALIVHHTGHGDQSRARGASSFKAALDSEIICRNGLLEWTKTKDMEPPQPIPFALKQVVVGTDHKTSEPITSCVVTYGERSERHLTSGLTFMERLAVKAIINVSSGTASIESGEKRGALIGDWREEFYKLRREEEPEVKQNTIKNAFLTAARGLTSKGLISENGNLRIPISRNHQEEIITRLAMP